MFRSVVGAWEGFLPWGWQEQRPRTTGEARRGIDAYALSEKGADPVEGTLKTREIRCAWRGSDTFSDKAYELPG